MASTGYVIDGVYHKVKPDLQKLKSVQQSTWRQADHDRQRFEYAADIVQPRRGGKPNQEFIDLYPDAAIDYGFVEDKDGNKRNTTT